MTSEETHKITVEELRAKAVRIKNMAETEVRHVAEERVTQLVVAGVVVVIAAVSIAYFLGSRRSR
ncbi:MAG: hypothetical protein ACYC77_02430 [Coriobacteriia bacterium]